MLLVTTSGAFAAACASMCDAFWSQVTVSGRRVTTSEAPSSAVWARGSTSNSHQTAALLAPKPRATALQNRLANTSALRARRGGGRTVAALGRRDGGTAVLESGGGGVNSVEPGEAANGLAGAGGRTVAPADPPDRACVRGGGGGRRMCRRLARGGGSGRSATRPAPTSRAGVRQSSVVTESLDRTVR